MGFKQYLKEISGRDVSKKFKIYTDDTLSNYQEVDIETARNIIVNKLAKEIAEKPIYSQKTREEIEDNLRLREIKQSIGDLFIYKYSVFNTPLVPNSTHINYEDYQEYEKSKADFGTDEVDAGNDTADSAGADAIVNRSQPNDNDLVKTDFGSHR